MATTHLTNLQAAYIVPAKRAQDLAKKQGSPAYVVLGPRAQVLAEFPGVWCHRVHQDGQVDCCVLEA